jgi:hypothetical protein
VRFLLLLAVVAGSWAQTLEQIRQRAIADLASVPNYVCVGSIERSLWIPGQSQFRRLDRLHLELAHIEGADRF